MGVNLKDLISAKETDFAALTGKKLGIDAYNWVYQFLSIIRLPTGELLMDSKGRITSHLTGIFNRTANLLKHGIFPCYVWDGEPPEFKRRTITERHKRKEEARAAFEKAETKEEKRRYAQQISVLTEDMIKDAEKLLEAMGIPSLRAPSEGEAQISNMVKSKDLWACASQDWDSLLFGSQILIRNLSVSGRKKIPRKEQYVVIKPELIDLKENLKKLGLSQEQLIAVALLIGTDYCPGVKGYGPKKAYEIVKKNKTLKKVIAETGWEFEIPAEKILDWFLNPETTKKYTLKWKEPEKERITKLLVDEHEFSLERVESQLKSLEESKGKRQQSSLGKFF